MYRKLPTPSKFAARRAVLKSRAQLADTSDELVTERRTAVNEILGWLKQLFLYLGQHPVALLIVVLIACFTLLRGHPSSGASNKD